MRPFKIDDNIAAARTPPSEFYTDEDWLRNSMESVFERSWQFIGHKSQLSGITPHTLLEGLLSEPLLLTSEPEGEIRCLSNVCTHRAMLLAEEPAEADLIRCRYHGRRFSLDGKCLSMPEFEGVEGFPSEKDDLARIPCETLQGFVFAGLAPAAPLENFLDGTGPIFAFYGDREFRFEGRDDYPLEAHWALYCENYLEGFHIPYVHPGLNKLIDYESYRTDLFRYSSVQTARSSNAGSEAGTDGGAFGGGVDAYYYFVFPNILLNFYRWGISVNIVEPRGIAETNIVYLTYVADESEYGKGAGTNLDTVEMEDQAVVRAVQKGIRSSLYERGRYSPSRETGIHHFHLLLQEFLGSSRG